MRSDECNKGIHRSARTRGDGGLVEGLQLGLYGMDQSLNLRGKRRPKSDLSVKATFCQRVKV